MSSPSQAETKNRTANYAIMEPMPERRHVNGTRLIITDFQKFVLQARIITGSHIGKTVIIPRIVLTSTQTKWSFVMRRIQFPVRPCYAMTINKSQGQSLKFVGLYLPKPVFSHGQLYVSLSRVTDPSGLKIVMVDDTDEHLKGHTRNVTGFAISSSLAAQQLKVETIQDAIPGERATFNIPFTFVDIKD
ncbi:uncharacterized protein [Rutidosis leptorrhynchoides]|uniref:uncharacterized protein n=1 Tax=Rutidosis leptorrhynchoides TaxID=125765 RepID=UPI003A9A61AF